MARADSYAGLLDRCRFPPPGTPAACAVSGGPDSLALMILAVAAGCQVTAWHVDHGWREESTGEAGFVGELAARYGARFRSVRVEVADGPNMEARARRARYAALPAGALTGHTADDQAETLILALLRGAGLDGLSAMAPGVTHPILQLRRRETEELCRAEGLTPVDDPTNADLRFRRNRVRHELLPLASVIAERDVVPLLARTAKVLRGDAEALETLAAKVDPTDVGALQHAADALARRTLRRWLAGAAPDHHPPDAAALDRVLDVVWGRAQACEVAGVGRVARSAGRLRIVPFSMP